MWAILTSRRMRMLVKEFGANVGPRNRHGDTPLHVAAQHVGDKSGIISMLVKELGADTAAVNANNGWAALHVAAMLGRDNAARMLAKELGANVGAVGACGRMPLLLAVETARTVIVRMLLDLGAGVPRVFFYF